MEINDEKWKDLIDMIVFDIEPGLSDLSPESKMRLAIKNFQGYLILMGRLK